jgi:hypothetical protein
MRLISILFLSSILLSCQSAPDTVSRPDWANVTLYATGFGPIKTWTGAERTHGIQLAKADSARQFAEQILALKTDSGEAFREKVIKEDAMKKITAYVRGAYVISIENKREGVEVSSRLVLGDPFKGALGLLKRKELSPPQGRGGREGSF